ncbi:MAG: hypothetical protein HYY76_07170 [Acidobacteria bacterium]|nr:hypothetical protein [Acidobacteriota bacterium]
MSPAAADDQYAQAIEDFDALRQILPTFRSARAWLRDADYFSHRIKSFVAPGVQITKGVVRDNAVCAVANKGCNTHASVRMLTDAGNGDDAMVLARVLLETAVIFRWMMIDQPYRLDLYCLSSALFKRRWTQLAVQHFSHESRLVADAKAALSAEDSAVVEAAFGNVAYRWTRERQLDGTFVEYSFEAMLKDIQKADGTSATNDFMYDVSYFMHSAHAHATADGMRQFKTLGREQFFTCQLGFNDGNCTLALQGANTYLCWLLGHVAAYLGLRDIEAELDQWFTKMKTRQSAQKKALHGTA